MIDRSDLALLGLLPVAAGLGRTPQAPQPLFADLPATGESLRVGVACPLHAGRARGLLARFRHERPDIEVRLAEVDEEAADHLIVAGDLDVALAVRRPPTVGLRWERIWSERLMAVLPEAHPLAAGVALEPAQLEGVDILLPGAARGSTAFDAAVRDAIGQDCRIVHHPVGRDLLFDMVALGYGVTIAPAGALGAFYPGVAVRPISGERARVDYGVLWRPCLAPELQHAFVLAARAA